MEYMEETRALLKYRLPLNEIIYDFFDALKSRSRGYASLDYELDGYERSELVKLDILVIPTRKSDKFYMRKHTACQQPYYHKVSCRHGLWLVARVN